MKKKEVLLLVDCLVFLDLYDAPLSPSVVWRASVKQNVVPR